jgi:GntR family uxuAB operon transcriptional repressor
MQRSDEDPRAYAEADSDLHARMAEAPGNSLLTGNLAQVNPVRSREERTRIRHLTLERGINERYNEQHRQIVDAMIAREGDRAASLMKRHLETARLSLTRAMAT